MFYEDEYPLDGFAQEHTQCILGNNTERKHNNCLFIKTKHSLSLIITFQTQLFHITEVLNRF